MKNYRIIFFIGLFILVASCGSKKGVVTKKSKSKKEAIVKNETSVEENKNETKESSQEVSIVETPEVYASPTEEYIAIYSDIAQDEMRQYGVPASITLAQGILESSSGK